MSISSGADKELNFKFNFNSGKFIYPIYLDVTSYYYTE